MWLGGLLFSWSIGFSLSFIHTRSWRLLCTVDERLCAACCYGALQPTHWTVRWPLGLDRTHATVVLVTDTARDSRVGVSTLTLSESRPYWLRLCPTAFSVSDCESRGSMTGTMGTGVRGD
jgi:hypothetical protein